MENEVNINLMPETQKERNKRMAEQIKWIIEEDIIFFFHVNALGEEIKKSNGKVTQPQIDELNRQMDNALARIGKRKLN